MSSFRVVITGGTGFVGHWMQRTCPEGVQYIALSRDAYNVGMLDWMVDLTHVVHLAPVLPDKAIEAAKKHNARFLYCSSGIVYQDVDTEYKRMKVLGEKMTINGGLDAVIARLFTFFGDKLDDGKAFTQFFQSARAGLPLKVYGDGSTIRSYMHGRDLGRVMWEILFNGDSMQAYDVGSDRPTTIKRLAERVSAFTGAQIEYIDGDNPVPVYLPNKERLWNHSQR